MSKKKMMKKKMKKKLIDFFSTLKPILIFSLLINVILLSYVCFIKNVNHLYLFAGENEYLKIESGVLSLNYDVNLLEGNNIKFIAEDDIDIKEIKIGYYTQNGDNLKEIVTYYEKFEKSTSLKETINNINNFNISEATKGNEKFKKLDKFVENNFYIVMEVKTNDGEKIVSKINLDVARIK